jgi:hypothetical protein
MLVLAYVHTIHTLPQLSVAFYRKISREIIYISVIYPYGISHLQSHELFVVGWYQATAAAA